MSLAAIDVPTRGVKKETTITFHSTLSQRHGAARCRSRTAIEPLNRLTSKGFGDLRGDRLRLWRCAPHRDKVITVSYNG